MTTLRNAITHFYARYWLWRSLRRTRQTSAWTVDPNANGDYDSPPVTR